MHPHSNPCVALENTFLHTAFETLIMLQQILKSQFVIDYVVV